MAPPSAPSPALSRAEEGALTRVHQLALASFAAVLLEATTDVLPDEPVLWVLTPLRLALAVGLAAVWHSGRGPAALRTRLDVPLALLVLASLATTVLVGHGWSEWRGLLTVVAAYYLTVGLRRTMPDSWPAIALLALVCVAIAGAVAAGQLANGTPTGFCRGALDGSADRCHLPGAQIRATGTFSNPNLLSAFLVLLLPVGAAGSRLLGDRPSRLVGGGLAALGGLALLLTLSRGGLLAGLAAVATFVLLCHPTPRRLGLAAVTVGVAGAGALALLALGVGVGVREEVWRAAARLVMANPLGVGLGRAGPLLDAAIPTREKFAHAHNLWLNWLVEGGLPGFLVVGTVTVMVAWSVLRGSRAGYVPAIAGGAGLAGFAVASMFDHAANATRIALVMWVVIALATDSMGHLAPTARGLADGTRAGGRHGRASSRAALRSRG